jgi:hypothetical protein
MATGCRECVASIMTTDNATASSPARRAYSQIAERASPRDRIGGAPYPTLQQPRNPA